MRKFFLLFCAPRSGSSALANYFRDIGVNLSYEPWRHDKREGKDLDLLLSVFSMPGRYQGIKHVYTHLDQDDNIGLLNIARDNDFKIIHLVRRNKPLAAISLILAFHTRTWQIVGEGPETKWGYQENPLPVIEIESIEEKIFKLEEEEASYYTYSLNPLQEKAIYYEGIYNRQTIKKAADEVEVILNFLEIPVPDYHERMIETHFAPGRKQNLPEMYRRIPNWEEISERYNLEV